MKQNRIKVLIITTGRIINNAAHNLIRNAWLTTAAVAVMIVTITILISATIANYALQEAIEVVSRDLTISIFVQDDASEEATESLRQQLVDNEFVDSVYFKSKEEALSDFQETYREDQSLLAGIGLSSSNPFPASFEVFMNDIDQYQQVIDIASLEAFASVVKDTNDNETSREAFTSFTSVQEQINNASLILGGIFGAISILVIFNTIRMAIFTRSDEIEIMKLIGATPRYIKGPFLVEAMLYGFVAAIVSLSIVYTVAVPFADRFLEQRGGGGVIEFEGPFPDGVMTFFNQQWYMVFVVAIAVGMAIGYFSASVALAKYMRLKKW